MKTYTMKNNIVLIIFFLLLLTISVNDGLCYSLEEYSYTNYNYVNDLALEGDYVWCAVMGGTVRWDRYDRTSEIYSVKDGFINKVVSSVAVDLSGTKWFGYLFSSGITRFDDSYWSTHYEGPFSVHAIAVDSLNVKWFGGMTGISSYNDTTWTSHKNGQPDVWSVAVDKNNVKWFGTWSDGIWRYDNEEWIQYTHAGNRPFDLITDIFVDEENNIWANDSGIVFKFDGVQWTQPENVHSLIGFNKRIQDEDGIIWSAVDGGSHGVRRNEHEDQEIWRIDRPLYGLHLWSTAIDQDFVHWYAPGNTGAGGSNLFYNDGYGMIKINADETFGGYMNYVYDVTADQDDNKWFGTRHGAVKYDGDSWTRYTNEDGLVSDHVVAVASDTQGNVFFGTNNGLSRFDGTEWVSFKEEDGLGSNLVRTICIDQNEIVWVGTTAGVSRYDGNNWLTYTDWDGLASRRIYASAVDADNVKWFGTRHGISSFNDVRWKIYNETHGLVYDRINDIAVDHENNIWVATDRGISRYDGIQWKSFTENDGLPSNIVHSIAVDPDGVVWFYTHGGEISIKNDTVSVKDIGDTPEEITLYPNFPNPFNASTLLTFSLPSPIAVTVKIYNVNGQNIRTLVSDDYSAGIHNVVWDGFDDRGNAVSSGIYFTKLFAGDHTAIGKMALVR